MPMPVSANYPKFTNDELYRFINEYEKHRMLYDFDHPLYTNYVERTRRFSAISRALEINGLTAERVRAKIKVFRGNYTHRLKEFYKKQKTGEPFNAPHWWFMADKFLRPHIRFLDPDVVEGQHPSSTNPNHFKIDSNMSGTEAEIYFGSDMPVSSTVEVVEEPAAYVEEEEISPNSRSGKQMNVKSEVVEERLVDNSIYLELDDEQLMAIENGEMSIEDVTARAEAAASQHQQQVARDRSMKAERISLRENARNEEEDDARSRTNEEEEAEDEFDAFGRCVALQLKTLPIDAALELESQIHTLITKKRMVLLRKNKLH